MVNGFRPSIKKAGLFDRVRRYGADLKKQNSLFWSLSAADRWESHHSPVSF